MPRMLAPRRESMRRSGASLSGSSRSSLPSGYSSANPSRRSNGYYGSQFSLRRSSTNNGSSQSSSQSLRQQKLYQYQAAQQPSNQNASWNISDQGSVSQPPSLASSETSVQTEHSLSRSSSRSSLQPPSLLPTNGNRYEATRYEAMHRYYALRRAALHQQTVNPESPRHYALHRSPVQEQRNPGNSFLPQTEIKEEDAWGQFVDVAGIEDDWARRRRLLSMARAHPSTLRQYVH